MEKEMKKCSECGAIIPFNSRFCPNCGAKLIIIQDVPDTESESAAQNNIPVQETVKTGSAELKPRSEADDEKDTSAFADPDLKIEDSLPEHEKIKPRQEKRAAKKQDKKTGRAAKIIIIAAVCITAAIVIVTIIITPGRKTREVINAIENLDEEVTLDSGSELQDIMDDYNALSTRQQNKVYNYDEFFDQVIEYNELVEEATKIDLEELYEEYCEPEFATLAADGSSLLIDTNPYDRSSSKYEDEAIEAIYNVNEALGLPDSVISKMSETRAIDGMQTYEGDGIELSWTYHPDNGLEVLYSLTED